MRTLAAIVWYEFLMQIKSIRFKGIVVVAAITEYTIYQEVKGSQEFLVREHIFSEGMLPIYLGATVFAALFSMGRIRKTGMHALLFTRPFPTFSLALGQLIACLISLLIPMAILFFPAGLIHQYLNDIDFPLEGILHTLLFYFIPAICSVLAVSIWIRTCFKNNIMALIVLGLIFFGAVYLGNSKWLNVYTEEGQIHHHIPMISVFSQFRYMQIENIEKIPYFSFTRLEDWRRFGSSMLYASVFLLLSCYHLRRTEPQRKVLGSYGRRWYHAPTFVKIAFDLKTDPHVRIKSHLLLFTLVSVIAVNSGWPMVRPWWNTRFGAGASETFAAGQKKDEHRHDPNYLPQDSILPIEILDTQETITPEDNTIRLRFRCDPLTSDATNSSGTLAILSNYSRWEYELRNIDIEGKNIPFTHGGMFFFIEGRDLEPFLDGAVHDMTLSSLINKNILIEARIDNSTIRPRATVFIHKKRKYEYGNQNWAFDLQKIEQAWPTRLTLIVDHPEPILIESPTVPESVRKPDAHAKKKWTTFFFKVPAEKNNAYATIQFLSPGMAVTDFDAPGLRLRFLTEKRQEKIMGELLDVIRPTLLEFRRLHDLELGDRRAYFTLKDNWQLNSLRRRTRDYAQSSRRYHNMNWIKDEFNNALNTLEKEILTDVFFFDLNGRGPNREGQLFDLKTFLTINVSCGMNNHFTLERNFIPVNFAPQNRHIDERTFRSVESQTREVQLKSSEFIPLFQMLYHVLGHEAWFRMIKTLKPRLKVERLTPEALEEAARQAWAETRDIELAPGEEPPPDIPEKYASLDWFFDYWCRDGMGFPAYRIESATFVQTYNEASEENEYALEVSVLSQGTGLMPVPIFVKTTGPSVTGRLWIEPGETVLWSKTVSNIPSTVVMDPQGWILKRPWRDENDNSMETAPSREFVEKESGDRIVGSAQAKR